MQIMFVCLSFRLLLRYLTLYFLYLLFGYWLTAIHVISFVYGYLITAISYFGFVVLNTVVVDESWKQKELARDCLDLSVPHTSQDVSKTFCICTQKVHVSNLCRVVCYFELAVTGECYDGKLTTLIEDVSPTAGYLLPARCTVTNAIAKRLKFSKLAKLHLYGRLENLETVPYTRCELNTRREQDGKQRYERSNRHSEG
jgi:hypothetical protein